MSQVRSVSQSKEALLKSYTKRLKDDVKSILDNFTEILKSSKVQYTFKYYMCICDCNRSVILKWFYYLKLEDESQLARLTQCEQDENECKIRAANIVSLLMHNNA